MKIQLRIGRYCSSSVLAFIKDVAAAGRISRQVTKSEWESGLTERDLVRARKFGLKHREHGRDIMTLAKNDLANTRNKRCFRYSFP